MTDLKQRFDEWLGLKTFADPELEKLVGCCYEWHIAFRSNVKHVKNAKRHPETPQSPRWLSILGRSGTGKTHCCRRLWEWSKSWSDWSRTKYSPMVIYWPGFVQSLKAGNAYGMRDDMRTWPVLFLDDVGAERNASGFATDELNALLGYRVDRWTLITSNLDIEAIKAMDGRISSRLIRGKNICAGVNTHDFAERCDSDIQP